MLTPAGLEHDREYAIVRVAPGKKPTALTQRDYSMLALIEPDMPTAEGITIHKRGMRSIHVPRARGGRIHHFGHNVWWDTVQGEDQGDSAAMWLREALDMDGLYLVRFVGSRPSPEPEKFGQGFTQFSDGFGMLLASEASLDELGRRTGLRRMADRMRPNITVTGCSAYEEDTWSAILWEERGCTAELKLPKPCSRCTIPRVDPSTGIPGPDPLTLMKPYRSGRALFNDATRHKSHYQAHKGEIFFGQNVNVVLSSNVELRVGDVVAPRP